jgi:hypothetical protein
MADYTDRFARAWPLLQQADTVLPRPNPTFGNPPFGAASLRVLVVRLSRFHDVDRSTPHLFLFQAVRRAVPDAYVDLAFFPGRHDREALQEAGLPLLFGTQSLRSLDDFDVVLISNATTLELVNLPLLLLHSGAPLMAGERDERWPPLILGGSNAMAAQAIVAENGDSLVDALFFGEGEGEVETLVHCLHDAGDEDKRARLARAASQVTGLWVTGEWPAEPLVKAVLDAPGADDLLVNYPRLNGPEAGTARLQINYGCPAFCSFCFEGYDRKPYRELPLADVLETARQLKHAQGCEALELVSFNFNIHRDIFALLLELNRLFDQVSFMSQRLDVLHHTPGLLEAEVVADKRSFTLGVEGISARLRAWLHKSLDSDTIVGLLDRLLRQKIRGIKLFYLLTGHENAEDLAEFRAFVGRLQALRRQHNPGIRVVFSFGLLVRMPFTPLRHDRLFLDPGEWRQIVGPTKSICETHGFEFRMALPWEDYCVTQVLAMGGHWLCEALIELAQSGHSYDEQLSAGYWEALQAWMWARGHWTPAFLGEKGTDAPFPLSFVEGGVRPDFLHEQYLKAKAELDEGICLGDEAGPGRCLACGACADAEQRRSITGHRIRQPDAGYSSELRRVMQTKRRLDPVYVRLSLPPVVAGTSPEWMNAWTLQGLLAAFPALTGNLLAARESLFTTRDNRQRYAVLHGETVCALKAWEPGAVASALAAAEGRATPFLNVLSLAEGFEPGRFRRAHLAIELPPTDFPDAGRQLLAFLRAAYVPCNVQREGAGYRFDLPARALKKKVLFEGTYEESDDRFIAHLTVGPKFDLLGYLRSFDGPDRHRLARACVTDLEW